MFNNVIAQVGILGLSLAIGYVYVYPTFVAIGSMQDQIVDYQAEAQRISSVNAQLADLSQRAGMVTNTEQRRLERFIPSRVDTVGVPRDVFAISQLAGVIVISISQPAITQNNASRLTPSASDWVTDIPLPVTLEVLVSGTYEQIKTLLFLLEQNDYPLQVTSLSINMTDGGFLEATLSLETYQFVPPAVTI